MELLEIAGRVLALWTLAAVVLAAACSRFMAIVRLKRQRERLARAVQRQQVEDSQRKAA